MSLLWFAEWLDTHEWSTALHESFYAYPLIESTHVVSIMLFVGMIMFVDLRLLGLTFKDTPVSTITSKLLPWTIIGFVITFVTGLLLFYAIPVRTYQSIFFRVKVIMLIVAFINIWIYHWKIEKDRAAWDEAEKPPFGARMAALISLFCWCGVIVMGRMIAYNWFDCDRQPQSDLINLLAECQV